MWEGQRASGGLVIWDTEASGLMESPGFLMGALSLSLSAQATTLRAEDFSREVVDLDPECGGWLVQGLCASRGG